jgi:inosine/xanthosine triphosphatase
MIVIVASENAVKVSAVREVFADYPALKDAEIIGLAVATGVSEQPKSLEETVQGAVNRAEAAFRNCDYSIGIESGLMQVPHTKTGNMDFCACSIYDGKEHSIGLSCAFEFPKKVTEMIENEGITASEAFYKSGLTGNKNIGSAEGAIGILTKGRVTRKDYTKQAVHMAVLHLENRDLY